jgi:hypothetical protein
MIRRLTDVISIDYFRQHFCPLLILSAGRKMDGKSVVTMVQLAIADYTREIPNPMASMMQPMVKPLVIALVDDEEVKADALAIIDRAENTLKEKRDNLPPAPVRPELSEHDKQSLSCFQPG